MTSTPTTQPGDDPDVKTQWHPGPTVRAVAGCRERLELSAWYDRDRQRLVLTVTFSDEATAPGTLHYGTISSVECGPFSASQDLDAVVQGFAEGVRQRYNLIG